MDLQIIMYFQECFALELKSFSKFVDIYELKSAFSLAFR